jgi:hypothetical protein
VPQPRSSTAVWIALALIVASIACVFLGAEQVRAAPSPKHLPTSVFVLYVGSLLGSAYFAIRLGFAGVMIVYGKPINRTVAWSSSTGAIVHCLIVLGVIVATIVLAPPQGFTLAAIGVGLALVALFVMGQYPNLAETQGWEVADEVETAPAPSKPSPRPMTPVVIAPLPAPVSTEAPRAAASSDASEPSLLR